MINEIVIMSVILLFLAAKKKPVFGQMTLGGEKALDWLKSGLEIEVSKIEIGYPAAFKGWNLPEWAHDRVFIGILHPSLEAENDWKNPVLITQGSVLKWLESKCQEWEEEGATTTTAEAGKIGILEFNENLPTMCFNRDPKAGQFAPYLCAIKE